AEMIPEARVYDNPEELLDSEQVDFIDIATSAETHLQFVELGASRGLPIVCQKPMATSLADAERMVRVCTQAGVPLFINENWRWQ
ncbi:Gfo/Idh/MocA family protein, partial [Escherichia coli]|uniref:Gfo/Idh/MocA family protein n=1 Tax=Escherichia coli TaxID=562 RepID=UPI003CE56C91